MTEQTPATPPAVWWSPSDGGYLLTGHADEGYFEWAYGGETWELPADAVRLVPDPAGADPARTLLADILAIVNRHRGSAASANEAMQEIEDAISTSMDALAIRAASPSGDTPNT